MRGKVLIRFGTYSIHNGCNGGLKSALRGMSQANIDLCIFQGKREQTESTPTGRPGIASS